jgi:hypothetical protein
MRFGSAFRSSLALGALATFTVLLKERNPWRTPVKQTFAKALMMSWLACLAACGPEAELQTPLDPVSGVQMLSDADCTSTYTLTNGTAKSGVSAGYHYWSCIYTLSVPAGATNLRFDTTGGTGDADLYVQFGSVPTELSYGCRSAGGTNSETCIMTNVQAGTYYVRVYGYSAASSVSLVGQYN